MAVCLSLLAVACTEKGAVDPSPHPIGVPSAAAPAVRAGEEKTDSLARGLALAMGHASIRALVRDVLRDSPFRLHAIHLASFLRGREGGVIAAKAASALGITLDAYMSMAESVPNLELVMPRTLDRVEWDGVAEIDVTAAAATLRERKAAGRVSERGYDVNGNAKAVTTLRYSARPYIIVRPAELDFPAEPEGVRAAASKQARNTVSTPAEERATMRLSGRERVARERATALTGQSGITFDGSLRMTYPLPGCQTDPEGCSGGGSTPPPSIGGGGATLSAEMTKSYCYGVSPALNATTDRDSDRIHDACEAALASRLAPLLNIGIVEGYGQRRPHWAASRHPDRPDNVQIIYALAYLRDGGASGGIEAHDGDSEFIILEIKNAGGSKWGVWEATLSAHFGADENYPAEQQYGADTYYWDDLEFPGVPYPRIWVGLDKHANFRNRAACESNGFFRSDSCHDSYYGTQIPAPAFRNLGNYYHVPRGSENILTQLLDCVPYEGTSPVYGRERSGDECFWRLSTERFSGWNPAKPDAVTPYRRIFFIFGF